MDRGKAEPLIFIAWLSASSPASCLPTSSGPLFDDYWGLRPEVMRSILTEHQDWCAPAGTRRRAAPARWRRARPRRSTVCGGAMART